jgi:porphobilinogen deaminase
MLLTEDSWNSLVLAKAGLERLGYRPKGGRMEFEGQGLFVSDLVELLPAAGQGAIGLEVRVNDLEIKKIVTSVSHAQTWFCTAVEREFLRLLGGGCQLPLGIRARIQGGDLCCEATRSRFRQFHSTLELRWLVILDPEIGVIQCSDPFYLIVGELWAFRTRREFGQLRISSISQDP